MIDPKIESAVKAALNAFSRYNDFNATQLTGRFERVFASEEDFLTKADMLDAVFDDQSGDRIPARGILRFADDQFLQC